MRAYHVPLILRVVQLSIFIAHLPLDAALWCSLPCLSLHLCGPKASLSLPLWFTPIYVIFRTQRDTERHKILRFYLGFCDFLRNEEVLWRAWLGDALPLSYSRFLRKPQFSKWWAKCTPFCTPQSNIGRKSKNVLISHHSHYSARPKFRLDDAAD